MKTLAFLLTLGAAVPAFAQQPTTQPQTPLEQALAGKLSFEINAGLQCSTSIVILQSELAKAKERIRALEESPSTKPPQKQ